MHPAKLQSLLQQALSHHQAGRLQNAAVLYSQMRALAPRGFEGFHLGGTAALQMGRFAESVQLLRTATVLEPKSAPSFMCLGLAHAAIGDKSSAERDLRHALTLDPGNTEVYVNLASILTISGKLEEAVEVYRSCLKIKPSYAQAWAGLGSTLHLLGRSVEAIDHFNKALALDPRHAKARLSRAQAYLSVHRLAESLADFEMHLSLFPEDLEARSYRLFILNYSSEISRAALFTEHKLFGTLARAAAAKTGRPGKLPTLKTAGSDGKFPRLSVAILSPDLRTHSVAYFLEPLLRHLDRSQFDLTLYHDHFCADETSRRLQAMASRWQNFIGQTNEVVEEKIRSDGPDILIDLAGHTGFNRLPLYARRLAPVQITYLGYPNTTGLAEMDYRFSDAAADPDDSDAFQSERLIRFSSTAWAYDPPANAPEPSATSNRPITFGSFNNLSKLSRKTLSLWATVLQSVPGSRLLLKGSGLQPERMAALLAEARLETNRIDFLPANASLVEHLATYNQVDISLDTMPYHGTTTTCEALWMGVPVVSLRGDRHASRVGASLLAAVGHPEWIANSETEYVQIAAGLADAVDQRSSLRQSLREDMRHSALLDHAGQARRFGDALVSCYREKTSAR